MLRAQLELGEIDLMAGEEINWVGLLREGD
jgi:hypothetical protein